MHGIVRRSSSMNRWRIDHLVKNENIYGQSLFLHYADLSDDASLRRIFPKVNPDEFYHLAGQSHVALSFEIPELTTHEIANATLKLLEICRDQAKPPKIYLAGSSEIFGHAQESIQTEETHLNPASPYGVCKSFCMQMGKVYRSGYDMHVSNGILYNHESPRRGENFVTQKIVQGAASISQGKTEFLELGNLQIERDWGYAPDFIQIIYMIANHSLPSDFIIASGRLNQVKDFLEIAFNEVDLNYQDFVQEDNTILKRSNGRREFDISKLKKEFNLDFMMDFDEMVKELIRQEINSR